MTTSGGGNEETPREGYYPDPSIPGYVRYWNGSAWVPGTSRPQPAPGEVLLPPAPAASALASIAPQVPPQTPPQVPSRVPPRQLSVEESGPMFLDEDPAAPLAQTESPAADAPAWKADLTKQSGVGEEARRISWGSGGQPGPTGQTGSGDPAAGSQPAASVPLEGGYGYPRTAPPATPGYGYPQAPIPSAPGGYGYPQQPSGGTGGTGSAEVAVPWQRQVQDLARRDTPHPATAGRPEAGGDGQGGAEHVVPWRPPVHDPFAASAQSSRPAGLGRRLAARVLDTLLIGAVVGGATFPLTTAAVRHIQDKIDAARLSGENVQVWLIDGTTGVALAVVLGGLLLAGLLYEVLPTVKWGRTLGKKLLRLKVLDIESQLAPAFGSALRRMLVRQLLDFVVVGVVNVLWCVFDHPWQQCWHDKAARTFVAADN